MTRRTWHRTVVTIISGGLLGILTPAVAAAAAQPATPPPAPMFPFPEIAAPQLPFPGLPASTDAAVSETHGTALPAPSGADPDAAGTNLGQPALAMLGVAGQGIRIPIPTLG